MKQVDILKRNYKYIHFNMTSFLARLLPNLLCPPFLFVRYVLHLLREVVWFVNGTRAAIWHSRRRENYGMSAHVLRIKGRYKIDTVTNTNFITDFILCHETFEHPRYILRNNVTLYCINRSEFVFVESEDGDDVWDVQAHAFSRAAQYRTARRVLVLPIHAAHRLARDAGCPQEKLIFILNTGRCGSTLACQIFQATGKCLAYSEPAVFNDLLREAGNHGNLVDERLIETTTNLLCKPASRPLDAHVIKIQPFSIELVPTLANLYPESCFVFMYRDIKPTVRSFPALKANPFTLMISWSQALNFSLWRSLAITHGFMNPHETPHEVARRVVGPCASMSKTVLFAIRDYLMVRAVGVNLAAVKYEHLIANPEDTVEKILNFCDLSQDLLQEALRAFNRDAQANSPVAKIQVKDISVPEYTHQDRVEIRDMCRALSIPDVCEEDFILAGTISG